MMSQASDPSALHGRFRIEAELARGGMGAVFRAFDRSTGRRVALKVLPFAAMLDKQQLARFNDDVTDNRAAVMPALTTKEGSP